MRKQRRGEFGLDLGAETVPIFGLLVSRASRAQLARHVREELRAPAPKRICVFTANVDHVVRFHRDLAFRLAYRRASLILPDGMPLSWAASLLGRPLRERVTGIDFLLDLCRLCAEERHTCFLLGASADVLAGAKANLQEEFPGLRIVGFHDGYFQDGQPVVEAINRSRAEVLIVGMGSPRQEVWIDAHYHRLNCRLIMAVGGSFDVIARQQRRAPLWMRQVGLEWLWRLSRDPRRLWKRYLIYDLQFIVLLWKELWSLRLRPYLAWHRGMPL